MSNFHMNECIRKTKSGIPLTTDEISSLVDGIVGKHEAALIPDYQLAAWLMAVCLRGLTDAETAALTMAMRDSGQTMSYPTLGGSIVDKHSTGGVGDKTTLILAPIVAACGVPMPKMSGRGLGHTGGTIDKLESIPGLSTALSPEKFVQLCETVGCAVAMQTGNLAPADKKLYALRDVTETVNSIPLICASIMSKKLATGADCILLDVKVGSGAFMKNDADAKELARLMLSAASADNKKCTAILTDMDRPLGCCIGNALEVEEAIRVLRGDLKSQLTDLCIQLAAELLMMAGKGDLEKCRGYAKNALESGTALAKFCAMVDGQGGDAKVAYDLTRLPQARCSRQIFAQESGYVSTMQSEEIGRACVLLGAGRAAKDDIIDPSAGVRLQVSLGDYVRAGDPLMTLYADAESKIDEAAAKLDGKIILSEEHPLVPELIHSKFTNMGDDAE